MKRYHIYKNSRQHEGRGYCGYSSDGRVMETDFIIEAVQMWKSLRERNPGVGWIIRDTNNNEDLK